MALFAEQGACRWLPAVEASRELVLEMQSSRPAGVETELFAFGLLALLLGLGVPPNPWLDYVLVLIGALLVLTIVRRARRALASSPRRGSQRPS